MKNSFSTVDRRPEGHTTPALVFGAGLTGTGVIRSLGRKGICCYVVCRPDEAVTQSRYYRAAPRFQGRVPSPGELTEYLVGLPIERAVLIPCSDDWTKAVANIPPWLRERFPSSVASSEVVEMFADKWRFAETLEELGIPHPKTLRLHSMKEMTQLSEASYENMFLKPINSQEFALHNRVKAFQLEGKEHAIEIMKSAERRGNSGFPILLQEYIPGPTTNYFLIDGFMNKAHTLDALIARRRRRMYPPVFGNSSFSETIPVDAVREAVILVEKILTAMDYVGIFDAELKCDARDGQYKLIEINARAWWFVEFATRCGVNLPYMAFREALGLEVEPVRAYDIHRKCFYLPADFRAHQAGDPGIGGVFRWLRSLKGAEEILYCRDDPRPGMASTIQSLRSRLTKANLLRAEKPSLVVTPRTTERGRDLHSVAVAVTNDGKT